MKAFLKVLGAAALATAASSCSSFLDINTNPNSYTSETAPTPDAILAQALSATASNYSTGYNAYSMFAVNYIGKSGVVNGYAAERTYNYSSSYYQGLFNTTYDILNDFNIIQQKGGAGSGFQYHAAVARIMKVYNYLLLVDEYGNIPYNNSLKGLDNLNPSYDDAATIYRDLIAQLTGAIADINAAGTVVPAPRALGPEDIVFGGGTSALTNWKRFANSLKLRILLRESQTGNADIDTFVRQQMQVLAASTEGFITTDVQVQPGYAQNANQQNPFYNTYGVTVAGTAATSRNYQLPTNFIIQSYTNNTTGIYTPGTSDPRVTVLYSTGRLSGVSSTVYVGTNPGESAPPLFTTGVFPFGSRFLIGSNTTAAGILKGLAAPTPLMLLAEQYFNRAEAETRGLYTGTVNDVTAKTNFDNGVLASFLYFYRVGSTAATTVTAAQANAATPGLAQYTAYTTAASSIANPNVNFDAATRNGALGKQQIIIFQKYLAENVVAATEAWDDFRRTTYPRLTTSLQAATPGRFPKRLLYPLTEVNTNGTNVPQGVTQYTPIFWDVLD